MRRHDLMQTIAWINYCSKDKPSDLVVDYLGLADPLWQALATYTESGDQGTSIDQNQAIAVIREKYEICCSLFTVSTGSPGSAALPRSGLACCQRLRNISSSKRGYHQFILRKFGYPRDKQEQATQTVLEQAELLSAHWAI
jgi:Domain of unknown function (DUF3387)